MITISKIFVCRRNESNLHKKWVVCLWLMIWSCFCTSVTQGRYRCMLKDFIRLGNSCYLLSTEIASWQEAHFRCRDRGSQLAVLASHYEDSTLRSYLERPEFAQLGRWIGGMWASGKWIWAAQGTEIESESSFVDGEAFNLGESDQWMCLYMDPRNRYHWNNNNCMRQYHYICEAPLAKDTNSSVDDASPAGSSEFTTSTTPTSQSYQEDNSVTTPSIVTEISTGNEQIDETDDDEQYEHNAHDDHADAVADSTNNNNSNDDTYRVVEHVVSREDLGILVPTTQIVPAAVDEE